jgi:hypothetical protein
MANSSFSGYILMIYHYSEPSRRLLCLFRSDEQFCRVFTIQVQHMSTHSHSPTAHFAGHDHPQNFTIKACMETNTLGDVLVPGTKVPPPARNTLGNKELTSTSVVHRTTSSNDTNPVETSFAHLLQDGEVE